MTIDNELDRPFGAGKVIDQTWEKQNLDDPEEEEIDPDDALEDEILDDPDEDDQLDETDAEGSSYNEGPRNPSRDLI